jgi:branched-chain amino acid transport system permease protein
MTSRYHAPASLFVVAASLAVLLLPFYVSSMIVFLVGVTILHALFAMSWALLFARSGVLVFGLAGFYAIGAYFVGFCLKIGVMLPFPIILLAGGVIAVLAAGVIGVLAIGRVPGVAFAILTLALAEILRTLISYSPQLGLDDGMSAIPMPFQSGVLFDALGPNAYFWFICVTSGILVWLLYLFTFGGVGRVLYSIRQDPERTEFLGHQVRRYRIASFMVAAGIAALAGGMYSPWVQIITPEIGNIAASTGPILATLLGGVGSFFGPVIGAGVLTAISFLTRELLGLSEVITGGALLIIILAAPTGITGAFQFLMRRRREERNPAPSIATSQETQS